MQRIARGSRRRAAFLWFWECLTVVTFAFSSVVLLLNFLPMAHFVYMTQVGVSGYNKNMNPSLDAMGLSVSASLLALLNFSSLVATRIDWVTRAGPVQSLIRKLFFFVLGLAGPALLAFAYLELCRVYVANPVDVALQLDTTGLSINGVQLLWILFGTALFYSLFTNVNFTSLHRYYRNRLCEVYLLKRQDDGSVESQDLQLLSKLRQHEENSLAPYHLINSAINLPSSDLADLRGRDCDFFLFSKHFCGSPVFGYHETTHWEAVDAHLDLGTAMAISGAAAAPQMGMGSIKSASFLLTLLNIRTGYWLHQPQDPDKVKFGFKEMSAPGPDYLLREAFNRMNERNTYLNLSDGGHIENLGIYELLRLRCKFVIAIDGEHDAGIDCTSLMRLLEFAKVDMNVEIEMDLSRLKWVEFTPSDEAKSKGTHATIRATEVQSWTFCGGKHLLSG
ncbi:MAG TPA: hypothetical protein EYG03_21445 [Planctomycetes bacterium]|nr:hypothetical protein [Fuerstiella sp.]HIK94518.1 hypothetical protein [Planctomycetota bacterium]